VGSLAEQRAEVAKVATKLFGKPFVPEQIINETLARSLDYKGLLPSSDALAQAIEAGIDHNADADILKFHPVAVWLENAVALEEREDRLVRGKPQRLTSIAASLSIASGEDTRRLRGFSKATIAMDPAPSINECKRQDSATHSCHSSFTNSSHKLAPSIQRSIRTKTVSSRLSPVYFKADEEDKKPIFPNVFSRASGHAFICVSRMGSRLEPREFRESSDEESEAADGYLIVGDDIWDPFDDSELLPEAWVRQTKAGPVPDSKKKASFPTKLFFNEFGECSESKPLKWWGWFMKSPLLFDPTSGVFYDTKTNEENQVNKVGQRRP